MADSTLITLPELLGQLYESRDQTLRYFELPDAELNKTYASGKWNVRQLLNHLADAETVLYERIRRVIAEPRQVLWAFDQDRWCQHLDYTSFPLAINRAIYTAVREGMIHLARLHYATSANKTFVHSDTGVRTLKEEFEKVAWHNIHHLRQIEQALGKQ